MSIYCDTCKKYHDCSVCPSCHGLGVAVAHLRANESAVECSGCAPPVYVPNIDPLEVLRGECHATVEDVCRAWIAEREAAKAGVKGKWYLGALNDGLFIADVPPSPCGTDIPPDWGAGCGDVVLNITDLPDHKAKAIVDAHNAALEAVAPMLASVRVPDARKPRLTGNVRQHSYDQGWNACREAMLAAAPKRGGGVKALKKDAARYQALRQAFVEEDEDFLEQITQALRGKNCTEVEFDEAIDTAMAKQP